jgi:stage IV sporulation protein FB
MLLSEPQTNPYDLRFELFRFPVRVNWLFWVVMAALGYDACLGWHRFFAASNYSSNFAVILVLWVASCFLTILVHELGHTFAFRYFGIASHIVLYQMGGLAIPGAGLIWARQGTRTRLSHWQQIIISAAGPGIQLALALFIGLLAVLAGYPVDEFSYVASWFGYKLAPSFVPPNIYLFMLVKFMVSTSIWWALLNLLPILPLDGGNIARHLIGIFGKRDGEYEAACVGFLVAIAVAYWSMQRENWFATIFIASLAYTNFQIIQARGGRSIW